MCNGDTHTLPTVIIFYAKSFGLKSSGNDKTPLLHPRTHHTHESPCETFTFIPSIVSDFPWTKIENLNHAFDGKSIFIVYLQITAFLWKIISIYFLLELKYLLPR